MRARALWLVALVGVAVACSESYEYTVRATLAAGLVVPDGAEVVLGGSSLDNGDGSIFAVRGRGAPIRTGEGVTMFEDTSSVCCTAGGDTINIYAYVDLDGSLTWDPGEPWGADPNNPVTIENDDYVSTIVVAADAQ